MIERLQRALEHVAELPPDVQEQIAERIEEYTEPLDDLEDSQERSTHDTTPDQSDEGARAPKSVRDALALAGAWRDLQDDDEFAALDRIRHESKPTPPMDEQLAWLNEDGE